MSKEQQIIRDPNIQKSVTDTLPKRAIPSEEKTVLQKFRDHMKRRWAPYALLFGGVLATSWGIREVTRPTTEETTIPAITATATTGEASGNGGTVPTTEGGIVVTETTTTTKPPETTTTEVSETTTTTDKFSATREALKAAGFREDAYDGVFSETTFEEALKYTEIPDYKTLTGEGQEIPEEIQKAFQTVHPDEEVVYVGEANRGLEMNAVITTLPYTPVEGYDFPEDFFGGMEYPDVKNGYMKIIGEFQGIVPIPGAQECLIELKSPFVENYYYVRLCLGESNRNIKSRFDLFYLKKEIQPNVNGIDLSAPYKLINIMKSHQLSELMQKGDIIHIESASVKSSEGLVVARDEYGFTMAQHIIAKRFEGMEKLEDVFKK